MKRLIANLLAVAVFVPLWIGTASAQTKVDLNKATSSQLQTLSGIGPSLAERILEFRAKNGPFKKIQDLMNVRGIGQKKFESLRDKITVGAAGQAEKPARPAAGKPDPPKGPPGGGGGR